MGEMATLTREEDKKLMNGLQSLSLTVLDMVPKRDESEGFPASESFIGADDAIRRSSIQR